jgi:hypothetical protein
MVYFQTKNPNLGKFWRVLQWKTLLYFMYIGSILQPFGIKLYEHLVYFVVIRYIFTRFGILYQDKSGNPAGHSSSGINFVSPKKTLLFRRPVKKTSKTSDFCDDRPRLRGKCYKSYNSCNAYSLRRGRRLPPTSEVEEWQFVIVIVIVIVM